LASLLIDLYPDQLWLPWMFVDSRRQFWQSVSNHKQYIRWLSKELAIDSPQRWYSVRVRDVFRQAGGISFLKRYGNSLQRALASLIPTHRWSSWLFLRVSSQYWQKDTNIKAYLRWLSNELSIRQMSDWLDISQQQVCSLKGSALIRNQRGLFGLLSRFFPDRLWTTMETTFDKVSIKSKRQLHLFRMMRELFPEERILFNHLYPCRRSEKRTNSFELDIFIENHSLAIEYQGEQHYQWTFKHGSPNILRERDYARKQACDRFGITILEIPFWWDQRMESLTSTIHTHRPDLLIYFHDHLSSIKAMPIQECSTLRRGTFYLGIEIHHEERYKFRILTKLSIITP